MPRFIRVPWPLLVGTCALAWLGGACATPGPAHPPARSSLPAVTTASPADLERDCENGAAASCLALGRLHERGEAGVAQDLPRAAALFERACGVEQAEACFQLGMLHMEGKGVQRDELAAFGFFRKACKLGDDRGCLDRSSEGKRAAPARASGETAMLHLLLSFGVQFGGTPLVEIRGSDGEVSHLNAGDAASISLGGLLEPYRGTTHALQLQLTGGYNYTGTGGRNGSAELTRWPFELLAFYYHRPYRLRIGGGAQYQLNTLFVGTGAAAGNIPFDNALGGVLQADWLASHYFSVYARYTFIGHTPAGSAVGVSGGGVGLGMSFFLPKVE